MDFSSGMMMMLAEDDKDVDTTSFTAEVLRRCSNGLVLYVLRGTIWLVNVFLWKRLPFTHKQFVFLQ
jgi:hypothetical protein